MVYKSTPKESIHYYSDYLKNNLPKNINLYLLNLKIKEYRGILSINSSDFLFDEIENTSNFTIILNTVRNCPVEISKEFSLSMLRVAWCLKASGMDEEFNALIDELSLIISKDDLLRAELILLTSYKFYPYINKMLPYIEEAETLFAGRSSKVILPSDPWCFGNYSQMFVFHHEPGKADIEANKLEYFISHYSKLTGGHGRGADALFRAELAHYRGDLNNAEILAYKSIYLAKDSQQSIVQLGACLHLCEIAVEKSDYEGWQRALDSIKPVFAFQNNDLVQKVLETTQGLLLNELGYQERIADWLKIGDTTKLPLPALKNNAGFVHINFLMKQEKYQHMTGAAEALRESFYTPSPLGDALVSIVISIGYLKTGDKALAIENLERAMEQAMPDGLTYLFAVYDFLLDGLAESLIRDKHCEYLEDIQDIKSRFIKGFQLLHDNLKNNSLPDDLTPREFEIAALAAKGLKNNEIAEKVFISENTVRTHLHSVYQKLDIDRRAKLAKKLL